MYAAVELLEQASASLTLETARSRNLAFEHFYSFSKLAIPALCETGGKFRVLKNSKLNLLISISYNLDSDIEVDYIRSMFYVTDISAQQS